ncbi:fibronectin-binding A domain, putative [Babesia ovis]|uniref:Fibronectin-binding A domain, putative n=1 Tax=Babesia ovis TaxID=5869 RepID=A0A9W5TBJ4_BABOV|nr:fibronectin-binding A domain, putative [Babesia ovis]
MRLLHGILSMVVVAALASGAKALFSRRYPSLQFISSVRRHIVVPNGTLSGISHYSISRNATYRVASSKNLEHNEALDRYPVNIERCTDDEYISAFDKIKNDEVILPPSTGNKESISKRLSLDFIMLRRYAEELNAVFANATFMGITHIPTKKPHVEIQTLDAALLHFRGFERGDALCLYYQRDGFPLVPSPAASYIPPSERCLNYVEKVMSGFTGLRVTKIHCPYFFKNVIAIDLRPAHQHLSQEHSGENYRIMFVAQRSGNRMVTTDNNDGIILLTSGTHDEKSGIKDGVGSLFKVPSSNKNTPDPSQPYANFLELFSGKEHMSLLKAMVLTYEGISAQRVTLLAEKAGIDSTRHISKIDNMADFYECYIRWLRSPDGSMEQLHLVTPQKDEGDKHRCSNQDEALDLESTDGNGQAGSISGNPFKEGDLTDKVDIGRHKTLMEYVFWQWGLNVPVYAHNRLAEDSRVLIDKTLERLGAIRDQCIGDEQQAERLAKVQERIGSISEYSRSLQNVMKWKLPEQFDLVKTIYEQVYDLGDLTGYRRKGRLKQTERERLKDKGTGERNVPHGKPKEVNLFKGILVIKMNPGDPNTPLIIVGRNAEQNERITHEISRPGDIWFHTKDCPGSHVLLRRYANSKESIQVAADIATYYSKARSLEAAPVISTTIDNVRKCPGAQIGAVLVNNYDTLNGYPTKGGEYVKAHRESLK